MMRLVCLLALVACKSPPPDTACQADTDCELVSGLDCCSACTPTAVSKAGAETVTAKCKQVHADEPDYFKRCPHLDCSCTKSTPACENHVCVVKTGPCTPQ